jgi:hypothetical protein
MPIRKLLNKLRREVKGESLMMAALLVTGVAIAASVVTFPWIMSMIGSQSQQAQMQVRIEMVKWDVDSGIVTVTVRNTGSVTATIESIGIRENLAGAPWYTDETADAVKSIDVGGTRDLVWDETGASATGLLDDGKSYVIRVTCTTGLYYESQVLVHYDATTWKNW